MHIPNCPTCEADVLPFSDALAASLHPSADYPQEQWLYIPPFYSEYRYILGTRGKKPLICVGVNPSTAAPGALDNTLKSVERVAKFNGYDSFVMFNVYAQRATRPNDMEQERNEQLHRENMAAFAYVLALSDAPAIWAAWGTIIEQRAYLPDCVRDMVALGEQYGARWFTAGTRSKKGHPHHPLYLKKDSVLEAFDATAYVATL